MLPVPTVADLAAFTGREPETFTAYAATSLQQATLLLQLVTKLDQMPSDPAQAALVRNAIFEMADRVYLEQSYAEATASPYQSETIGSYTYSLKSPTAVKARSGGSTGLTWWDLAVDLLSAAGTSVTGSGSVGGGFDVELGVDANGRRGIRDIGGDPDFPPYIRIS